MKVILPFPQRRVFWAGTREDDDIELMVSCGMADAHERNILISRAPDSAGAASELTDSGGYEFWVDGDLVALSNIELTRTAAEDSIEYAISFKAWASDSGIDQDTITRLSQITANTISCIVIEDLLSDIESKKKRVRTIIGDHFFDDVSEDHPAIGHLVALEEAIQYQCSPRLFQDGYVDALPIKDKSLNGSLFAGSFLIGNEYRFCIDRGANGTGEVRLTVKGIQQTPKFKRPDYIIAENSRGVSVNLSIEDILWAAPVEVAQE